MVAGAMSHRSGEEADRLNALVWPGGPRIPRTEGSSSGGSPGAEEHLVDTPAQHQVTA